MNTASDDQTTEHVSEAALRAVMRQVPATVTVVTARSAEGQPLGVTIGSFTSVSLRPPLISFNVAREANVYALLKAADRFAVHILRRRQAPLAARFADPEQALAGQFEGVAHRSGPGGVPVLEGALAVLHCRAHARFRAGDSDIVVGRVVGVEGKQAEGKQAEGKQAEGKQAEGEAAARARPLVYHRRGYRSIEAEAQALADQTLADQTLADQTLAEEEKRSASSTPETPAPKSAKS